MDPAVGDATTGHEPLASIFGDGTNRSNFEGMIFQEMAPCLRAADSAQDRRRLSREFDARITPFLGLADDARCRVYSVSTRCCPTTHGMTA
jgi:hypothetical protein